MSVIVYNGVACSFVHTKQFGEEDVYLGPDVAVRRYTATWELTIHRQTAGTALGDAVGVIGPDGVFAWQTVHDAMMTPRSAFRWVQGNRVLFDLAVAGLKQGLPGDCELGPKPLSFNIIGFNGNGSLVAQYTLQWALPNPCEDRNGKMGILAHVWKVDDDIDQHFFLTRTYMGVIRLDPRVIGAQSGRNGIHPDAVRQLVLPPRTPQMYRNAVQVRTLEDGYTIAYRVQDRQPTSFVNSNQVVRMEASHKVTHGRPGIVKRLEPQIQQWQLWVQFAQQITGVGGAVGRPRQNISPDARFNREQGLIGGIATWWQNFNIRDLVRKQTEYQGIPTVTHTIQATAYGHPASLYSELAKAARVVCTFRLMNSGLPLAEVGNFDGSFVQEDRSDPKSVTCALEVTARPNATVVAPRAGGDLAARAQNFAFGGRPEAGFGGEVWLANNQIPQFPNVNANRLVAANVQGPRNQQVPTDIRQLIYGGTILNGQRDELWGWVNAAFAPDIMSTTDATARGPQDVAFTRVDATTPRGVNPRQGIGNQARALEAALIAAVQDPCAYKEAVRFAVDANGEIANRQVLP